MKLGLIQQLNENVDQAALNKIADQIFALAENSVADQAADEGGTGFTGDNIERKSKQLLSVVADMVGDRIAKDRT